MIVTVCECDTTDVVTVKVTAVAPPWILTVVGTAATAVLELVRLTTVPEGGAACPIVRVPITVVGEPPTPESGEMLSELTWLGLTVRAAFWTTPAGVDWQTAEIVTVAEADTAFVVTAKDADIPPYGIVTLVTVATALSELFKSTTTPTGGAAALIVTVPVTPLEGPPTTETGEMPNELT